MKRFMFRYVASLLLVGSCTPARSDVVPDPPSIPFTLRSNKVILPVTVDGSRELDIILDSGMSFDGLLLYNSALRDSITLRNPVLAAVGGAGSGAQQTALMDDSSSFRAGGVEFRNQRIVILDGEAMRGFPSDGVCGRSLFGSYAVEINYDRMIITLHKPGAFRPDASWATLPITFKANDIPWIEASMSVRGADSTLLSCYIDLASNETLELLERDAMRFQLPANAESVLLGTGLSGDVYGRRAKIAWAQLGSFRIPDVTVAIAPAGVRSKQPGADAVLANGFLRRFNCVFDYAERKLYLRPVAAARG